MDRIQELEVVKTACSLEYMIKALKKEAEKLDREKPSEPRKPLKMTLQAQPIPYPEIVPPPVVLPRFWIRGVIILGVSIVIMPMSVILAVISPALIIFPTLLSVFGFMAGCIILLVDAVNSSAKKRKITEQRIEEIRNSPEYQMQCRQIDSQNQAKQAQLDKKAHDNYIQSCVEYNTQIKEYREQLIPDWQREVNELNNKISFTDNALQEVYNKNVIPFQYCNLPALTYLAMFLSTSEYDLKYAIERYDMYVVQTAQREQIDISRAQLQIQREIVSNQQYANWQNEQIISLIEEGNAMLQSVGSSSSEQSGGGILSTMVNGLREQYRTVDLLGSAHCAKARGKDCRDCRLRHKCTRGGLFNHILR